MFCSVSPRPERPVFSQTWHFRAPRPFFLRCVPAAVSVAFQGAIKPLFFRGHVLYFKNAPAKKRKKNAFAPKLFSGGVYIKREQSVFVRKRFRKKVCVCRACVPGCRQTTGKKECPDADELEVLCDGK